MNKLGKVKGVTEDENGYRQFIVNCLGTNDHRKYFSISPFGIDFNIPLDTRALTTDSTNKDQNYNLGILNKVKVEDLNPGECAIFSSSEDGTALAGFLKFRNDGTSELNGNTDFIAGFNKLKEGFDEFKGDYNGHKHQIPAGQVIISVSGGSGAPAVGVLNPTPIDLTTTDSETSASIDESKKSNLKTE